MEHTVTAAHEQATSEWRDDFTQRFARISHGQFFAIGGTQAGHQATRMQQQQILLNHLRSARKRSAGQVDLPDLTILLEA